MSNRPCAVITGAGSGIGRACVKRFLDDGFQVVAVGRRMSALEETREALGAGNQLTLKSADVRKRSDIDKALVDVEQIDVLVANAGICSRTWLHEDESDGVFMDTIDINVHGVWHTFRAVHQKLGAGASAVMISSGLGKLGRPGYSAYTASKHAVLGMVKCLAPELAPKGIRVNAVCPGWVDTEMAARDLVITATEQSISKEAARKQAEAGIPLSRFVSATEVAQLVRFLTSPESSAITGQSYNISCGEFTV